MLHFSMFKPIEKMAELEDEIEFVPRDKGFAPDPNAESWKDNFERF